MFYSSSVLIDNNNNYYDYYEQGVPDGLTEYVSHTNSSIQVRVLTTKQYYDGWQWGEAANDHIYGAGLCRASGAGDLAFYRAMQKCAIGRTTVATFDCSGGSDVTPGPPMK